jgi:thiopeptide-type bacteriocin biosynthesis protein
VTAPDQPDQPEKPAKADPPAKADLPGKAGKAGKAGKGDRGAGGAKPGAAPGAAVAAPRPLPIPAGFFVLRTPLLPFDDLLAWGHDLRAPAVAAAGGSEAELGDALAHDKRVLRERLAALLARPEVREAVFVASPSLDESLAAWQKEPDSERGEKVERSITRYLARMCGRSTPFGIFAGCSTAELGAETNLVVAERARYGKHTRLDGDYIAQLTATLARDPAIRAHLSHRPNTSLYEAAGQLRYAEARLRNKMRSYHLVAVEPTDYLLATLARAADGAEPTTLAQALVDADPEVTREEADGFVGELIDSQLLVPELEPAVTGPEPIHNLVDQLARFPAGQEAARVLGDARAAIEALDAVPPGAPPDAYRKIAADLAALPTPVELPRLFQVDMTKAAPDARLGQAVVDEIARSVNMLYDLAEYRPGQGLLDRFKQQFAERYEDRELPLVEVLDEESGIGFGKGSDAGGEASPLLEGLALGVGNGGGGGGGGGGGQDEGMRFSGRDSFMLKKLMALAPGTRELVLGDDDIKALSPRGDKPPMPDSFAVMATIAARSAEALAQGDFLFSHHGASGPSGANLLGRFCHGEPALEAAVRRHLADEEALRPDAVLAEIVHLPEGRIGNILARPVLRKHEIVFLGRSGAGPDEQILISDLMVSVRGGKVVLRSKRLGREVLPRLTTAHNFSSPLNLGAYKFLCSVQFQNLLSAQGWSWGVLEVLEFLPRLRVGKMVLARARWRLDRKRLEPLGKEKGAKRFAAVQKLRAELGLPRFVEVADGDNELPVDLDNLLSVETFVALVKDRGELTLVEMWPGPDELIARGPEGRFTHELVLPFLRQKPEARAAEPLPARPTFTISRAFAPGSEWLYAKLYTGSGTADRVLRDVVAPVVRQAIGSGAAESWFFIRYSDPDWHVRVRFRGDAKRLAGEVLPALHEAAAPLLASGAIHKLLLDTYGREIERYGGDGGMALSEAVFQADSEAVLGIVELLAGDAAADARWRLTLRGMDQLLADLGFDLGKKLEVMRGVRENFGREFGVNTFVEKQLGDRFRRERGAVEALLDPQNDAGHDLEPGLELLSARSARVAPLVAALRAVKLDGTIADLAPSYLHMHANRLLRAAARAQELVLYDFLCRVYESRLARQRKNQ